MTIDEAIWTKLTSITAITDAVAIASIAWIEADQSSEHPRIVFKKISDPTLYDSNDKWQRWRFYITHPDRFECQRIANILYNQINRMDDGLTDDFDVDYISNIYKLDPEFQEDSKIFQVIQDYRMNFH